MAEQPVTIAEELATALFLALVRRGVIGADELEQMNLSLAARDIANSLILEASAPRESDWRADMARAGFHVVRNDGEAG